MKAGAPTQDPCHCGSPRVRGMHDGRIQKATTRWRKRAKSRLLIERSHCCRCIERHTHDYDRHVTTTLLAGLIAAVPAETKLKARSVIGTCMPRRRAQGFRKFLDEMSRTASTSMS